MKLAFATLKYYPFGGLEKSFLNICREALTRGHELTIFCREWQGDYLAGADIQILPARAATNHGRFRAFYRQLQQRLSEETFDGVVGFKRMPGLDVYYNGDVCFRAEASRKHGAWYQMTPRYRLLAEFEEQVFSPRCPTHILTISAREKAVYQQHYQTPDERFHLIPPGLDRQRIESALTADNRRQLREDCRLSDTDTVMLMVGSDFLRKGVDRALHALAALPVAERETCYLWVIGQGKRKPMMALARRLGIEKQITFWGGRDDVPRFLAAADLLLHPARFEVAGNAIIEALVAGLPVLVSASAGFSTHVEAAKAGWLIADSPYLQETFDTLLNEALQRRSQWPELKQRALDYAEQVDLYRRPQVAMDVIERVLREKG